LWPPALGCFAPISSRFGHDTAGYGLLTDGLEQDVTQQLIPGWGNAGRAVLRAVCGHHGRPPRDVDGLSSGEACGVCIDAAREFAIEAMEVVGGEAVRSPGTAAALGLTWRLAGLAVLADWTASNETWFAANPAPMKLATYWREYALPQASRALAEAGFLPARARTVVALSDLAPHATAATPLQALANTVELPGEGPVLVVIEDQTGAGKTEAALLLAHRMMAGGAFAGNFRGAADDGYGERDVSAAGGRLPDVV
jgi:CRISPR-associated endonuclease/helicase Cas3